MTRTDGPPTPPIAGPASPPSFRSVFARVALPMFVAVVDQSIVATALPTIAVDLQDVSRASWVIVSYLVAVTIAAPVYGRLSDVVGRRRMMVIGLALVTCGSILCALAVNMPMLIAARAVQGAGAGGLLALANALLGATFAPRERARYQGYFAGMAIAGHSFGPVLGGFLTEGLGWRAVFWINLPLGLLAIVMTLRLPKDRDAPGRVGFDYRGLALFAAFVLPLLLALELVKHLEPAAAVPAVLLLAFAVLALFFLLAWERRAPAPLLPLDLFGNPTVWRANVLAFCHGAVLTSMITYIPFYLTVIRGTSPAEIGVILLPMTGLIGIGAIATGRFVSRTGRAPIVPTFGLAAVTAALAFFAAFIEHLSTVQLTVALAAFALVMGPTMPVVQILVQVASDRSMLGTATAAVQFARALGTAVGAAIVGVALFAALAVTSPDAAGLFASMMARGSSVLAGMPEEARALVQQQTLGAFRAAFLTMAVLSGGGAALALTIPIRRV